MSETTTTISPAVYHEILKAIQQGGHEIELTVTTAPDGTQTQTVVIRPAAPLVETTEEKPAPKPRPQPRQAQRPSAPPCTADRCTMSPMKPGPDGYYTWGNIADRMWAEKNKKWWQRYKE